MELVEYWNSKKVCEFLGITSNNLYQLNYRKQLSPSYKEGKLNFYRVIDVLDYKEKCNALKNN